MRVDVVDPSAFTPPYDHALCSALGRAGADVRLMTSRFAYGEPPAPDGYRLEQFFYRRALGSAGSGIRRATKLAQHLPDMLRYRRAADQADIVHFQWLDVQWLDRRLLPKHPLVLTAHDLLPREPRLGQAAAQRRLYEAMDAVVVHSGYGASQLTERLGIDPRKVRVIHHGAFDQLTRVTGERPLPDELAGVTRPVALFFGLLRPYKGLETLLRAWQGVAGAELWIVGRARMPVGPLQALASDSVRFVTRFVSDRELPAYFRRADVVVLPYSATERFDQSGVLATALAFAKPVLLSDVGGFSEVAAAGAAELIPADDPAALRDALTGLIGDPQRREQLSQGAARAAAGPYSWDTAARATLELYRSLTESAPL